MPTLRSIVAVTLATCACSSPGAPAQPTPTSPAIRFPDLAAMAGAYTLTIDLDNSCSTLPAAARKRVYQATLEDRGWHYLVVSVAGGGFAEHTQIADLFSGELSSFQRYDPRLKWNNFDFGCDILEPLGDSTALGICGEGPISRTATTLTGAITGTAYLARGTTGLAQCTGTHQFVFER